MKKSSIEEYIQVLRENSLRVTQARVSLLNVLLGSEKSLSIKAIFEPLSVKGVDLASVYRNLSKFEQMGIVHQLSDGQYKLCDHLSCHKHPHLIVECERCHSVLETSQFDNGLFKKMKDFYQMIPENFQIRTVNFLGTCKKCKAQKAVLKCH